MKNLCNKTAHYYSQLLITTRVSPYVVVLTIKAVIQASGEARMAALVYINQENIVFLHSMALRHGRPEYTVTTSNI